MKDRTALDLWCDRRWIKFGCVVSAVMLVCILGFWNSWGTDLKILASVAVLIPLHVVEEWVFPGGFHYQYNVTIYHSDRPDRYPMCRLSDMFTNLITTFIYVALVIYSLATGSVHPGFLIGTAIFSLLELVGHTLFGAMMYFKFRSKGKTTIYGPGSITAYFGFGPIFVLSLYCLQGSTITALDWVLGIGLLLCIAIFCILIPENVIKDKDSKYYFKSAGYFDRFLQ